MDFFFFFHHAMLGVGLAMDAFSVSLANGLADAHMKKRRILLIAGTFAFFQALMPMIGWLCVHTAVEQFSFFEPAIPWIALALLGFLGAKMIWEGVKQLRDPKTPQVKLTLGALLLQGVATSIDALSVGFTIAELSTVSALAAAGTIAAVTFVICLAGVLLGRLFGMKLSGASSIMGGLILILIGLEIFISSLL
ncbi:MAG: manganese efflux pump [Clostridia bacterium]|nr:manganese efflux pump [Clostridia bacterium]